MTTLRTQVNTQAGSKGGLGGLLGYWYFYMDQVVSWDVGALIAADNLQGFVTGSVAAFFGVAGIAGWNRDQPSPAQPELLELPEIDLPAFPVGAPARPAGQVIQGIRLSPVPLRRNSGFVFSERSLANRVQLDAPMQRVATRGLAYCPYDWVMIESGRTDDEQRAYVKSGASKTLDSRHCETPVQAFDIKIIDENGEITDEEHYYIANASAMREAAIDEGIKITAGALDWGWDFYHFERSRAELPYTRPSLIPDIHLPT